ncbi:hypothetical protein MaudCBS49596_003887 [Microsporum audouinii]
MATSPTADLNPSQIDDPIVKDRLKEPFTWGWVVYRCSYSDEEAWQQMRNLLHKAMVDGLENCQRRDLLPYHKMTIMDNKAKFSGATSHDIRDHFTNWAADTLMDKLVTTPPESDQQLMRHNNTNMLGPESDLGTQYNFCLFVDDICLESLKHMTWPVVKLLHKLDGAREPGNRGYTVYPGWEDGESDCAEEAVGWMYIRVMECMDMYEMFMDPDAWHNVYCRPPFTCEISDRSKAPGHWRNI